VRIDAQRSTIVIEHPPEFLLSCFSGFACGFVLLLVDFDNGLVIVIAIAFVLGHAQHWFWICQISTVQSKQDYSPSSGGGVESRDVSASLVLGFVFANDLNRAPAVWLFLAPDLESDLFRVPSPAGGCEVDHPEVLSSEALPWRTSVDVSFN
jgi:hypothetical protein